MTVVGFFSVTKRFCPRLLRRNVPKTCLDPSAEVSRTSSPLIIIAPQQRLRANRTKQTTLQNALSSCKQTTHPAIYCPTQPPEIMSFRSCSHRSSKLSFIRKSSCPAFPQSLPHLTHSFFLAIVSPSRPDSPCITRPSQSCWRHRVRLRKSVCVSA